MNQSDSLLPPFLRIHSNGCILRSGAYSDTIARIQRTKHTHAQRAQTANANSDRKQSLLRGEEGERKGGHHLKGRNKTKTKALRKQNKQTAADYFGPALLCGERAEHRGGGGGQSLSPSSFGGPQNHFSSFGLLHSNGSPPNGRGPKKREWRADRWGRRRKGREKQY